MAAKNSLYIVFGFNKNEKPIAAKFDNDTDLDTLKTFSKKSKLHLIELSEKDSKKFKLPNGKLFDSGKAFIPFAKASKVEELMKLTDNKPSAQKKSSKQEEDEMAGKKEKKSEKKSKKSDKKDKVEKKVKKEKKSEKKKDKKADKKDKVEKKEKVKVEDTNIVKFDDEWKVKLTKAAKEEGFELKANNFVWTLSKKKSPNFLNVTFAFTKKELQYCIVASSEKDGIDSNVFKVKDQPEHEVMVAHVNKNLLKLAEKYLGK
jgi:outer membrane biosynthesis protein TonB